MDFVVAFSLESASRCQCQPHWCPLCLSYKEEIAFLYKRNSLSSCCYVKQWLLRHHFKLWLDSKYTVVWKKHSKNKYNNLKHTHTVSFFSGSMPGDQGRNLLFLQLIIKTSSRNVNVLLPCVMGRVPFSLCCGWNWFHFKNLYWCPVFGSSV